MTDSGPSLTDDVAITALVISLIALVIGLSQLLQAILGTAEGYRRCAESVIGPWSKLRRRVFRPYELRVEVRFVTPAISIVTEDDISRTQHDLNTDELFPLKGEAYDKIQPPSSKQEKSARQRMSSFENVLNASLHLKSLTSIQQTGRQTTTQKHEVDNIENGIILQSAGQKAKKRRPRNNLQVTWLRLLHDLHILYLQYWPAEDCLNRCQEDSELTNGIMPWVDEGDPEIDNMAKNRARTLIAVTPVEDTWDFMPTDVIRPLARSTISDVLIIAMRLGLQWRTLDRNRSQMNADGNGYTISSTDVKGLGTVLRFARYQDSSFTIRIIPSRAADKLMCGMLPGDPVLVRQDFELINSDRKLIDLWEFNGVYSAIGLDNDTMTALEEQNRWTTHNEVVTLLCTFLPLRYSELRTFWFTGWKARQYSLFHFFESRYALVEALKSDNMTTNDVRMQQMRTRLTELAKDFPEEFCNGYSKRTGKTAGKQQEEDLVKRCAKLWTVTTDFFKKHKYQDASPAGTTWYMQLVAAHARLSAYVNGLEKSFPSMIQSDILLRHRELIEREQIKTDYFAEHLWRQAKNYAEAVNHPDYGIVQYMNDRGFTADTETIIISWWMLMLRGIVWDMSCVWLPREGEPVVSSYYYDKTAVWFT